MNRNIVIFVITLTLISCGDRYKAMEELNEAPDITLQPELDGEATKTMTDSVKLSKPEFSFSPFYIITHDANENIRLVRYRNLTGRGTLFYKNEIMKDTIEIPTSIESSTTKVLVKYVPSQVGITTVLFIVSDRQGKSDSAILKITAFNNLEPSPALNIQELKVVDPYEYSIDASESYDKDAKFGGVITKYFFSINNEKIETISPSIKYIFPGPGNYTVKLKVQDNDNVISQEISKTISLQ